MIRLLAWALILFTIPALAGCGSSSAGDPTQADILEMLNTSQRRHDPINFSEVELGEFYITRENDKKEPLYVRFTLVGIVHTKNESEFKGALEAHKNVLRDSVRAQVLETEIDYLNDPKLDWLQNQFRTLVNRNLQTQDCRDVVFANFELEEPFQ